MWTLADTHVSGPRPPLPEAALNSTHLTPHVEPLRAAAAGRHAQRAQLIQQGRHIDVRIIVGFEDEGGLVGCDSMVHNLQRGIRVAEGRWAGMAGAAGAG